MVAVQVAESPLRLATSVVVKVPTLGYLTVRAAFVEAAGTPPSKVQLRFGVRLKSLQVCVQRMDSPGAMAGFCGEMAQVAAWLRPGKASAAPSSNKAIGMRQGAAPLGKVQIMDPLLTN